MTIEWTTTEPRPPRVVRRELQVYEVANGARADRRRATPADLVAALAAMGEGERAEVLREFDAGDQRDAETKRADLATARAEKAVLERSEWRTQAHHELGARPNESLADAAIRMRARAEKAERECAGQRELLELIRGQRDVTDQALECERVCRLRNEAELNKARLELDRVRASLDVVRHDLAGTRQELREAREARDELRVKNDGLRDCLEERKAICEDAIKRAIAAESAAAAREPETLGCSYTDAVTLFRRDPSASWTCDELQKNHGPDARCRFSQEEARMMFAHPGGFYSGPYTPTRAEALATDWRRVEDKTEVARPPREYPLAEGSRWDGDEIVDLDGTRTSAVGRTGGAHIWCVGPWGEKRFPRLDNVLALAHRRGLV